MAEIKVSVLCTAFNHEKYIAEALECFVNQRTDFPFEVIVNDDCSTDGTAEIIRQYAEKYPDIIRPFYQQQNIFSRRGISGVYDEVMYPNARGKYIAFCEGDDLWTDENKLQLQADYLDQNPDYIACVHNTLQRMCDGSEADRLLDLTPGERDMSFADVAEGLSGVFHTSSIMARREYILDPPDYYYAAGEHGFLDYAIALRLTLAGRVRYLDRPMSLYRISSNRDSWSSNIAANYGKLTQFVSGEIAMFSTLLPRLSGESAQIAERVLLEREFELAYLEGRDEELVKPRFREIYAAKPLSFRLISTVKRLLPGLHRAYRHKKGYVK